MRIGNPLTLWRTVRGCCLAIVLIALILTLATCAAVGWGIGRATAASDDRGLDVILVIDQSGSLWELGGVGSDPQMLRIEGARLFAAYLGVDGTARDYRLGVIFFGTRPALITPLTSLKDPAGRQGLLSALGQRPEPMGWTDINAALALAYQELFQSERADPTHATAIVLFTDGRPQTEKLGTPAAGDAYLSDLRAWITRFTDRGTAVFTVLLGNAVTDADPQIRDIYRPLWVSLAESGIGVRFYDARASQDLAAIYHDIVVQLHRGQSQGAILDQAVEGSAQVPVQVPAGWRRASFVIHKSDRALEVSILRPDGSPLQAGDPGLHYTGEPGGTRHEVWSVDQPPPGQWIVQARGRGMVTVWLDYQLSPATPTLTPTASPTPTETPSPSPTRTPAPPATPTPLTVTRARLEVLEPQPNGRYPRGRPVRVAVRFVGGDVGDVHASLTWNGQPDPLPVPLVAYGAELLTGQTPTLDATGVYTLTIRQVDDVGRGVIFQDEAHVLFVVEPGGPPWGWILTVGALALSGGAGGLWWRHRNQPLVDGTLRLVQGPEGEKAGRVWDLSQPGRGVVALGRAAGCDVVLAHDLSLPPQAAVIRARRDTEGHVEPILTDLSGDGMVLVNGQAAGRDRRLNDGDLIQVGGYRLRYENLSLRVRAQVWRPRRKT
ncbi:MAG: VWA domain-containing protein [Anaerolineae bacterium]